MIKKRMSFIFSIAVFLIVIGLITGTYMLFNPQIENESVVHPKLFFTVSEISGLREASTTTHADIWQPILEYAEKIIDVSPPTTLPDGSDNSLRAYGNTMIPLAFACVITDEDHICNQALNYLLSYSNWHEWHQEGVRDLGLAHMLIGNALGYDWLYSKMTEDERVMVRQKLAIQAQQIYEASAGERRSEWGNWWRLSFMQNHYWTANSALGMVALVLKDEPLDSSCRLSTIGMLELKDLPIPDGSVQQTIEPDTQINGISKIIGTDGKVWIQLDNGLWAQEEQLQPIGICQDLIASTDVWLDQAVKQLSIGKYIWDNITDGSWHEGLHYQKYLLTMSLPFMLNAKELESIDLLSDEYLQNVAQWYMYNLVPDTPQPILSFANFEVEWGNAYPAQNLLRFIASQYNNGNAEWAAQEYAKRGRKATQSLAPWYVFEFLYYDPSVELIAPLKQTAYFPDSESVIWRTGWEENSLIFGLKSGPVGGQFAYDSFINEQFPWPSPCTETGCQLNVGHNHDDTGTFYIARGSTLLVPENVGVGKQDSNFHNTLLIDGQGQYRVPADQSYRNVKEFENADASILKNWNTPNYDYLVTDLLSRYPDSTFTELTRQVLFVRPDYFIILDHIESQAIHEYAWNIHLNESIEVEERWIKSAIDEGHIMGIGVLAPELFRVVENSASDDMRAVAIHPELNTLDTRFIHVLLPTTEQGWTNKPSFELLEDTGKLAILRSENESAFLIEDIIIGYDDSSPVIGKYYTFDGDVAVIKYNQSNSIEYIFVSAGRTLKRLNYDEEYLVELDNSQGYIEIEVKNHSLIVSGDFEGTVRMYKPDVEDVLVNNNSVSFELTNGYVKFSSK